MIRDFSRRNFLSTAVAGIGGILSGGFSSVFAGENKGAWSDGKRINPAIDNLRVVHCVDPAMIKADPKNWDMVSQNAPVVSERVHANINAMACALAQKASPTEAWETIFQKPKAKSWHEVKVAIKPNASGINNNTRVAVIGAVCTALTGLGVKPENIAMYGYRHGLSPVCGQRASKGYCHQRQARINGRDPENADSQTPGRKIRMRRGTGKRDNRYSRQYRYEQGAYL
jgi:hypothetical protein